MKRVRSFVAGLAVAGLVPAGASAASGPQVWASAGCGSCHTMAAAGSSGNAGPNLDQLRPSVSSVASQVTYGGDGMPAFGSSFSSADIQALAAWVAASTSGVGIAPTVGSTVGSTSAPTVNLPAATVKRIQVDLLKLGYFSGPVTGFYGPLTTAAVKQFQRASRLKVDGIWGPLSEAALKRRLK